MTSDFIFNETKYSINDLVKEYLLDIHNIDYTDEQINTAINLLDLNIVFNYFSNKRIDELNKNKPVKNDENIENITLSNNNSKIINNYSNNGVGLTKTLLKPIIATFQTIEASDPIQEERLSICKSCEFYKNESGEPSCGQCGCPLKTKISIAEESCPLKKWVAIKTQSSGGCGCGKK